MGIYTKNSLERLREKTDLIDVVSSYVKLHPSGGSFKGLCPFHEEKTPSFLIQKGDSHYHCFGCGAHGDAIAFLMGHMKMSFVEAVDVLAERFHITLDQKEKGSPESNKYQGPSKEDLRTCLSKATDFYHAYLLHTDEGHQALEYLYQRGLDLDFIRLFKIGYAPRRGDSFGLFFKQLGVGIKVLEGAGLVKSLTNGKKKVFFSQRITFPILDISGRTIGFSARHCSNQAFGPKYINTPETILFKKSQTLFGLNYSRRRIAKGKQAIVVEGQIDALRLIEVGLTCTVAGQGTAFTDSHVQMLIQLGVTKVYLVFDGDEAGKTAHSKVGNLFQKEGVEVYHVLLAADTDPDSFLKEYGIEAFIQKMEKATDHLSFLVEYFSQGIDQASPSAKNHLVQTIVKRIQDWSHPLMVHESLRKLARITHVPEHLIGVGEQSQRQPVFVKRVGRLSDVEIDPYQIMESDLLRWLFLMRNRKQELFDIVKKNINPDHFITRTARRLFSIYMETPTADLLSLANHLESPEEQLLFSQIVQKRVNHDKMEEGVREVVARMLHHHWMEQREAIKIKIHSGRCSDSEVLEMAKEFDRLKSTPPSIQE